MIRRQLVPTQLDPSWSGGASYLVEKLGTLFTAYPSPSNPKERPRSRPQDAGGGEVDGNRSESRPTRE